MLSHTIHQSVQACLQRTTDNDALIASCDPVSGGCINDVYCLKTTAGDRYLLKTNSAAASNLFETEAAGLSELRCEGGPHVPEVIATGGDQRPRFLLTEWVETGPKPKDFFETFGRSLAELHRTQTAEHFGFDTDNFIGSTPQINRWNGDWCDFFCEQRLGFQIKLACENGYADAFPQKRSDRFLRSVHELLQATLHEPAALIHGDLWSGNYLCGNKPAGQGRAVMIDPAVYYASREAEFGMTTLFGGFDNRFYDAYSEAYPLVAGWEKRADIYRLYHLLNHLNLFGTSYLGGCREIISQYA